MTEQNTTPHASEAGTFALGGDLEVNRLGFGAMRITAEATGGEPRTPEEPRRSFGRCGNPGINPKETQAS